MNYTLIKWRDIADGPGIRVSLFVSGCRHHCPECFNPETWSFTAGMAYTQETQDQILEGMSKDYIRGLTLLGGEPFEPENQGPVLELVQAVRQRFPQKNIWCYTGYTLETDIMDGKLGPRDVTLSLLKCIDILVDGEFHKDEKNPELRFRGSANQRIIDVKKTLSARSLVLWDEREEP